MSIDDLSLSISSNFKCSFCQDFVRLPWQNQSNQNSASIPLGPSPPPPPGSGALHRGYGSGSGSVSVSGQLNPGMFSSGINPVAHSLDSEDMEPSSVKLLRYDWLNEFSFQILMLYLSYFC